ncbi:MAG: lytic transglycosylase [Gammaproteobacteria bacterium]|nr:MAG: lytic transglycosylase [Gammaproteobacteria bacterium]
MCLGFLCQAREWQSTNRIGRVRITVVLGMFGVLLLPGSLSAGTAGAVTGVEASAVFAQALTAARNGQWKTVESLEKQLGDDFPLQAYLDYHRLRVQLPKASSRSVNAYIKANADSPLADSMRRLAIEKYGQHGEWKSLLAVAPDVPASTASRCYYTQALLYQEPEQAYPMARDLWLHGDSLPPACDALFRTLKDNGYIDDELTWQRMLLAYRHGSPGLMRYLRSEIRSDSWQVTADTLLRLYQSPAQVKDLMAGRGHIAMATAALYRLAEKDPVHALAVLPEVSARLFLPESDQDEIRYRAAWFSTIRDLPENRQWLDSYLAQSDDLPLLEHRIRRAIVEQDWVGVERWIQQLPDAQRSARWHYWHARALESTQRADAAKPYFVSAAQERSFWGFLAAQHMGMAPSLNAQVPMHAVPPALDEKSQALVQRVSLLLEAGERYHAREEWLFYFRHRGDEGQHEALAQTAVRQDWPHLAIDAALQSRQHDRLDWRFPLAYEVEFAAAESKYQVDRWLLMALARRESAFNAQAASPVGAQGLMQLMPGTARQVATQVGVPYRGLDTVHNPGLNIALGSHYLAGLLKRYNGNRVLALAAYNAGPNRVDRWLEDANAPMDVFIESIPFYETREYVQAVLAYRVILSRHRTGQPLLALLDDAEIRPPYSAQMLVHYLSFRVFPG